MDIKTAFLHLYFYELESLINNQSDSLTGISFQSEEANTDIGLKKFLKTFISDHKYLSTESNKGVTIVDCDGERFTFKRNELSDTHINNIYLPKELTSTHKEQIKSSKSGVFTKPDLYIELKSDTTNTYEYISIELKSTKDDKIPGSSIQQVTPHEWVIFVQRKEGESEIAIGQYINTLTGHLPFPDRSPRPEISYNSTKEWNQNNRMDDGESIVFDYSNDDTSAKKSFLEEWHKHLAAEWIDVIQKSETKKSEKWFNHTIRLYTIEFINYYESLDKESKKELLNRLKETAHLA